MARSHSGLPKPAPLVISKTNLLESLRRVDADRLAVERVLVMENEFRRRITSHVRSLPLEDARFGKFNTNPFVLLFHALKNGYGEIGQIEQDILPAKIFSSMETSAGRMVEAVVLPVYGWEPVPSMMHTINSVIDGRQLRPDALRLATLKSGPRCLNDEMSENIADAIIGNVHDWARSANVDQVEFTYGVLYGTKKQSNKKDWHILRKIEEKVPAGQIRRSPRDRWDCAFTRNGIEVTVTVRIGVDLWNHLAESDQAFIEITCALIRACVTPMEPRIGNRRFTIADLAEIISLVIVPAGYNVSLLQRSQWEWLFFFARHFCDQLTDL